MILNAFYQTFGFDYNIELSTKPDNAMGSDEVWDRAINNLKGALEKDISYKINEGDGAFYDSKIDFHWKTVWEEAGNVVLFSLIFLCRKNFDLYILILRVKKNDRLWYIELLWATERFIGILIEQFAGLCHWLAQLGLNASIADRHIEYGGN